MGHLSRVLAEILASRDLTERQAADASGMPQESFRKILRGMTARPRDATLKKIAEGLSVPLARLVEARALDANEKFASTFSIDDITATEALEIAIARVDELSPEEVADVRAQAEALLRAVQEETPDPGSD